MARWPTVVRLPSGLAHGRRTPEAPGSRPVLAQNQGVRVPIPARAFLCPQKHAPGFFCSPKLRFCEGSLRSACPHSRGGFFCPQKTRPKAFSGAKMLFWLRKHMLIAPIPTYVGICVSPFPQGLFMPPKTRPRVFPEAKVAFRVDETLVWHTPPDPPDWCHQVPLRPSLPHAPGVRMTAVTTNSLKLLNDFRIYFL